MENQYARVLGREGNRAAQKLVEDVFEVTDRKWRGVGNIPASGLQLRSEFREHDAEWLFDVGEIDTKEPEFSASAARFCVVSKSRMTAPPSERFVLPRIRWARPWFPPKALAPLITPMGAI